ncbi:MAG TPA: LacI family DNA-binding transcriptional regulator [Phototrophicaceae bacterium]|nr:LacI family DNA-binding transcriptional regulator [Phototrophicaceae bacterium]
MMPVNGDRATIEDVAQRAGVSTATVSRVVNRTGRVSEATIAKVQAAIDELSYHPSAAARGLAARRTYTIGLTVYQIGDEFSQGMLRGIESTASANGFDLLIHSTRHTATKSTSIGEHNTDGLIVFADSLSERELIQLHLAGFPVVVLHRSSPRGVTIPSIMIENQNGARQLVEHLIEGCGRQRIAYLAGRDNQEDSYWREMGYREALAAHQIGFSLVGQGDFAIDTARMRAQSWLADGLKLDAIFAGDDESAIGVLLALRDGGVRVPEEVAVVGFDDIRLAQYLTPPLTTVRAPVEEAAKEAVNQLLKLIQTGEADAVTMLPTELVIRQSCGFYLNHSSEK